MRRHSICIAALAAVTLALGLAPPASAQTTVYNYDDGAAWWNSYGCAEMKILLPPYADADGDGTANDAETAANHEKRVCVMYDMLPLLDRFVIETFISSTDTNAHATHKAWWDAQNDNNVHRQILAGALRIAGDSTGGLGYGAQTAAAEATGAPTAFNGSYDGLGALAKAVVDSAGDALSGRGDDMEDAPAIPLVGLLGLGGLLAGRGWWLRRRRA
jgi:hypothetical protein